MILQTYGLKIVVLNVGEMLFIPELHLEQNRVFVSSAEVKSHPRAPNLKYGNRTRGIKWKRKTQIPRK